MKRDLLTRLNIKMSIDSRVNVYHRAIMIALMQLYKENDRRNPFQITRRQVMSIARIRGCPTYHKYIRELEKFDYLEYFPSYHPAMGSQIRLK